MNQPDGQQKHNEEAKNQKWHSAVASGHPLEFNPYGKTISWRELPRLRKNKKHCHSQRSEESLFVRCLTLKIEERFFASLRMTEQGLFSAALLSLRNSVLASSRIHRLRATTPASTRHGSRVSGIIVHGIFEAIWMIRRAGFSRRVLRRGVPIDFPIYA